MYAKRVGNVCLYRGSEESLRDHKPCVGARGRLHAEVTFEVLLQRGAGFLPRGKGGVGRLFLSKEFFRVKMCPGESQPKYFHL